MNFSRTTSIGRIGCGVVSDDSLGGRKNGGGGGYGQDRVGCGLIWWEDNVAHVTLGMNNNTLLAYSLGLELHHLIMSMLINTRGNLEKNRDSFDFLLNFRQCLDFPLLLSYTF